MIYDNVEFLYPNITRKIFHYFTQISVEQEVFWIRYKAKRVDLNILSIFYTIFHDQP